MTRHTHTLPQLSYLVALLGSGRCHQRLVQRQRHRRPPRQQHQWLVVRSWLEQRNVVRQLQKEGTQRRSGEASGGVHVPSSDAGCRAADGTWRQASKAAVPSLHASTGLAAVYPATLSETLCCSSRAWDRGERHCEHQTASYWQSNTAAAAVGTNARSDSWEAKGVAPDPGQAGHDDCCSPACATLARLLCPQGHAADLQTWQIHSASLATAIILKGHARLGCRNSG